MKLVDVPIAKTHIKNAETAAERNDRSIAIANLTIAIERLELSKRKLLREWEMIDNPNQNTCEHNNYLRFANDYCSNCGLRINN